MKEDPGIPNLYPFKEALLAKSEEHRMKVCLIAIKCRVLVLCLPSYILLIASYVVFSFFVLPF